MPTNEMMAGGWTYQRYSELDDDTRYEVLGGALMMIPAPGIRHQRVLSDLGSKFHTFVRERGLGEVFLAPTDVVLSDEDVVQPDILFIGVEKVGRIMSEEAIHGAPDLVVEIFSPTSLQRDRGEKRALYENARVPEYWMADPANRTIEVLSLSENGYDLYSTEENGAAASRVLSGFAVVVDEVFRAVS